MKVTIQPYNKMRYETCGDYIMENGHWHFYIAKLEKRRYEWLVLIHEIIECYLCSLLMIKEKDIYEFDLMFEQERKNFLHTEDEEPGDDRQAPYYYQHQIATFFEKIFAFILFVNWREYDEAVVDL